jgi:hypothetical protein
LERKKNIFDWTIFKFTTHKNNFDRAKGYWKW